MKRSEACCFTGHRPEKLPWKYNENDARCTALKSALKEAIEKEIESGAKLFFTGMALGTDIWAAESVLEIKKTHCSIKLVAVVPYANQSERWSDEWKERYRAVLKSADHTVLLQQDFSKGCLHARNRYMVEHSARLIAVYNGEPGGTSYTVDYARRAGLKLTIINPN